MGASPGRCREKFQGAQCVREHGHLVIPHCTATGTRWPTKPDTPTPTTHSDKEIPS